MASKIDNNSPFLLSRGVEFLWNNPKWRMVRRFRVTNNLAIVLSFSLQNDLVCRIMRVSTLLLCNHLRYSREPRVVYSNSESENSSPGNSQKSSGIIYWGEISISMTSSVV